MSTSTLVYLFVALSLSLLGLVGFLSFKLIMNYLAIKKAYLREKIY